MGPGSNPGFKIDARSEASVGDVGGVQDLIEAMREMRDLQGRRHRLIEEYSLVESSKFRLILRQVSIGHAVSPQSVQLWSYGIRVVSKRHGEEQGRFFNCVECASRRQMQYSFLAAVCH